VQGLVSREVESGKRCWIDLSNSKVISVRAIGSPMHLRGPLVVWLHLMQNVASCVAIGW